MGPQLANEGLSKFGQLFAGRVQNVASGRVAVLGSLLHQRKERGKIRSRFGVEPSFHALSSTNSPGFAYPFYEDGICGLQCALYGLPPDPVTGALIGDDRPASANARGLSSLIASKANGAG